MNCGHGFIVCTTTIEYRVGPPHQINEYTMRIK
jgi:hypothetical protein